LEELVFAVPTVELWNLLPYKEAGLIKGDSKVLDSILCKGLFRERSSLETDSSFKQLITYALVSTTETVKEKPWQEQAFFLFQRRPGQTEKRLQNMYYLGAGGHMNPGSGNETISQYLFSELRRELFEELKFPDGCSIDATEFIGFINDDSIKVGTYHLGLLFDVRVSNKNILINEKEKMLGNWVDKNHLIDFYEEMETWSKIAFDSYIKSHYAKDFV
jgi:predicted NUDIX family phosphoesterase